MIVGDAQPIAGLARIEKDRGNLTTAIELYRRALSQDYQQFDWRLELARALAANEQLDEAIHEVKVALRLRPHDGAATKLFKDFVSRPAKGQWTSGTH